MPNFQDLILNWIMLSFYILFFVKCLLNMFLNRSKIFAMQSTLVRVLGIVTLLSFRIVSSSCSIALGESNNVQKVFWWCSILLQAIVECSLIPSWRNIVLNPTEKYSGRMFERLEWVELSVFVTGFILGIVFCFVMDGVANSTFVQYTLATSLDLVIAIQMLYWFSRLIPVLQVESSPRLQEFIFTMQTIHPFLWIRLLFGLLVLVLAPVGEFANPVFTSPARVAWFVYENTGLSVASLFLL